MTNHWPLKTRIPSFKTNLRTKTLATLITYQIAQCQTYQTVLRPHFLDTVHHNHAACLSQVKRHAHADLLEINTFSPSFTTVYEVNVAVCTD